MKQKQIEQTITTLEIAEMMEIPHNDILRKLDGRKDRKGYVQILTESQMAVSDYFIQSTYKDASGKENKCYRVTKMGCDFLANKFSGEKGVIFTARYVKRFCDMEEITQELTRPNQSQVPFKEVAEVIPLIASDLKVNNISHLVMYKNLCNDYGVPSGFLPVYVQGGDREKKPVTDLLKEIGAPIGAVKFNKMLVEAGILEERSRKSSKSGVKYYKSLTTVGLEYGENQINPNNPKETQPYYYVDTFQKLYDSVVEVAV